MKRNTAVAVLAALLGSGPFVIPAGAQAPRVREFHGDVTAEELKDVLKPKQPSLNVRGIGAVADKPNCDFYRKQHPEQRGTTRGIAPVDKAEPVADAAALNVQFAFNSSELTPESAKTLDQLGNALTSRELESCCFQIEGHTDNVGSSGYNRRLSEKRAQSVVHFLKKRFNLDVARLLAVGQGKEHPIADNETDEGRARNRRVQIVNLGFGQASP